MTARPMSLLDDLFDHALRSDYPEGTAGHHVRPAARALTIAVVAVVGFILAVAAVTVLRERPTTSAQRGQLLARVDEVQAANATLDSEIATRTQRLDSLAAAAIPDSAEGIALRERLSTAEAQSGYTEVSGSGVNVTLGDGEGADPLHRVLDRDVQALVNGLWSVGAEAIAINGIRLTALTAIRSAGDAILVDYRPLAAPYEIAAVGADLEQRLMDSSEGAALRTLKDQFGIRVSLSTGPVTVPAASAAVRAKAQP